MVSYNPRERLAARANERREARSYNAVAPQPPTHGIQLPLPTTRPAGLRYAQEDGKTHINLYIRSLDELGRQLSHFAKKHFVHPYYGPFDSMEAFWHYIKAAKPDDQLRTMYGAEAKFYGRDLPQGPIYESFYDVVIEANFHKIVQNKDLREMMTASTLPFDHYYLFGPGPVFMRKAGFDWLVQGMERIREELQSAYAAGQEPQWPTPVYEAHVE